MEVGLGLGHIVLDGDPAPPKKKGHSPQFSARLLWPNGGIKMPLGMEVGLSPVHIVIDGDQLPPPKGAQLPTFRPMSMVAKRLDGSICHF